MKPIYWMALLLWCGVPPVVPGLQGAESATARENNVNVRGQPSFAGEIITRLKQGEVVTVLEEVILPKPKAGEPAKWVKIAMPANTPVWVASAFLDPNTKTVTPKRLNLRAGPGENFSVIGRLEHGFTVNPISVKDDWTEIEQPPGTYAYVAADLLNRATAQPAVEKPATPAPATKVLAPSTTPTNLIAKSSAPAPIVPRVAETKDTDREAAARAARPPVATPPPAAAVPTPVTEPAAQVHANEISPVAPPPLPRHRIVRREGFVSDTVSIQAPTPLGLDSLQTRNVIDFLLPTSTNIVLKKFKGLRVVVTGEEAIDRRWRKVPVLYLETIQAVAE